MRIICGDFNFDLSLLQGKASARIFEWCLRCTNSVFATVRGRCFAVATHASNPLIVGTSKLLGI